MPRRTYESSALRVFWDSSVCIHTGICLQRGDGAFDTTRRPWIDLEMTDPDTVVATIEACPSGALRYERLDGGPDEEPDHPTTVVPWPNGPLLVRGEIEVQDRHGETFTASPRVALCRCGASDNQPFCDLSHKDAGFRDYPRVTADARAAAEAPSDVSEETLG